jgi:membrane peptidoglycan carboxypeptidase
MPPYDASKYCASVALGGIDVSPLEMASAYGVFANHGTRVPPTPVLRILDHEGKVLLDNTTEAAQTGTQAITPEVADNVTDVLQGVLTSGTAAGRGIGRPAAGKTGTAQDNWNAWFVGYTPTLSTSVWIGYQQPKPLVGIAGVNEVTGASVPARTWQRFMTDALKDVPITDFADPAPIPDVRDQALRERHGGMNPGPRRAHDRPLPSDGYDPGDGIPVVDAPPITAPTTSSTSTSTTRFNPSTTSTTFLFRP